MNEEELHRRIKTAIILLQDGHPIKVGDLAYSAAGKNKFSVAGWTRCNTLENLTEPIALAELAETKILFNKMVAASRELNDFIKGRQIEYSLFYDDSGKCSLEICSETNGVINWAIRL